MDQKTQTARDALLDAIASSAQTHAHPPHLRDLAEAYQRVTGSPDVPPPAPIGGR